MALNALNKLIKSGGGLLVGERSDQKASQNAGLNASPTTPLGLASLGVGPDTAKMAGTQQQKIPNIAPKVQQKSILPSEQDTKRRKQAQQLQALDRTSGSLDSRVDSIVAKRVENAANTVSEGTVITNLVTQSGLTGESATNFTDFLNQKTLDSTRYRQLAKDLGIIKGDDNITSDQQIMNSLNATYFDPKQGKLVLALGEEVKVGDLLGTEGQAAGFNWAQDLGFQDEGSLLEFLGLENSAAGKATLAGKTINELNNAIDNKVGEVFSQTKAAEAIVNDPTTSELEKERARTLLVELGARGIQAGEQEASKGAQALRGAETVAFRGKEYKLQDLLKSQEFTDSISDYFKKTPEEKEKLKKDAKGTDKEFYRWLDANETQLGTIAKSTAETLGKVQAKFKAGTDTLNRIKNTIKDDKRLAKLVGVTSLKFGEEYTGATTEFGKMVESLSNPATIEKFPQAAAQVEALGRFLNNAPDEYIDLLKDKNIDWYKNNGLWSESDNPADLEQKLNKWKQKRDDIKFLDSSSGDLSQFGVSEKEMNDLLNGLATIGIDSPEASLFDANKDGKMDSVEDIKKRLKTTYGEQIGSDKFETRTLKEVVDSLKEGVSKVYPTAVKDGFITVEELGGMPGVSMSNFSNYLKLAPNTTNDSLKPITRELLQKDGAPVGKIEEMLNKRPSQFNNAQEVEQYTTDMVNLLDVVRHPKYRNHPWAQSFINEIERKVQVFIDDKDERKRTLAKAAEIVQQAPTSGTQQSGVPGAKQFADISNLRADTVASTTSNNLRDLITNVSEPVKEVLDTGAGKIKAAGKNLKKGKIKI